MICSLNDIFFVSVCILIFQNGKIMISFKRHSFVLISILIFQNRKIKISFKQHIFCFNFHATFFEWKDKGVI